MDGLLAEPLAVLLAVVLASLLVLLEGARPMRGLAAGAAFLLVLFAGWGVHREGAVWWPLLAVAAGVLVWGSLLGRSYAPLAPRVVAALLYGSGALAFALLNADTYSVFWADFTGIGLPMAFPWILRRAHRFVDRSGLGGPANMVGEVGTVMSWSGAGGIVRVDTQMWDAVGPIGASLHDRVIVRDVQGVTLVVAFVDPTWPSGDADGD